MIVIYLDRYKVGRSQCRAAGLFAEAALDGLGDGAGAGAETRQAALAAAALLAKKVVHVGVANAYLTILADFDAVFSAAVTLKLRHFLLLPYLLNRLLLVY